MVATAAAAGAMFLTPVTAVAAPAPAGTAPSGAATAAETGQGALTEQLLSLLPADYQSRIAHLDAGLGISEPPALNVLQNALAAAQPQCASTPVADWLTGSLAGWTTSELIDAIIALPLPEYDALVFADGTQPQTFGVHGESTTILEHTFKDLKRFWDIPGGGIQLVPMHGSMLSDHAQVQRSAQIVYDLSDAAASQFADIMVQIMHDDPVYKGGDAPVFTFNSVSTDSFGQEDFPGHGVLPNKIIMGDGVMQAFEVLGTGKVSAEAILAHEYGHQNQYADNQMAGSLPAPQASRRIELMADAYSSYFLAHPQGEALNADGEAQAQATFSNVGDCQFTAAAHHGTPEERQQASKWGEELADDAHHEGHVLPSVTVGTLFDAALPTIVASDAG
jgi:hypothetical protein